jgi:hypothetical protein
MPRSCASSGMTSWRPASATSACPPHTCRWHALLHVDKATIVLDKKQSCTQAWYRLWVLNPRHGMKL